MELRRHLQQRSRLVYFTLRQFSPEANFYFYPLVVGEYHRYQCPDLAAGRVYTCTCIFKRITGGRQVVDNSRNPSTISRHDSP